jgi:hypothetical protein
MSFIKLDTYTGEVVERHGKIGALFQSIIPDSEPFFLEKGLLEYRVENMKAKLRDHKTPGEEKEGISECIAEAQAAISGINARENRKIPN